MIAFGKPTSPSTIAQGGKMFIVRGVSLLARSNNLTDHPHKQLIDHLNEKPYSPNAKLENRLERRKK